MVSSSLRQDPVGLLLKRTLRPSLNALCVPIYFKFFIYKGLLIFELCYPVV